ncbi:exocyst complex component EXO70C1-like [Aristolochia californica]|uniref:exocyst complex component EXO70C1-like n=1 Tax=Aristolochia californica TaxID=171875 RepID=UPI0035DE722D
MDRKFSVKGGSGSFSNKENATSSVNFDSATAADRAKEGDALDSASDFETRLGRISGGVDSFVDSLSASRDCHIPPDVPEYYDKLVALVDGEVAKYDTGRDSGRWCRDSGNSPLLDAVGKLSRVATALTGFPTESKYSVPLSRGNSVLQRAMTFLEEEFRWLLEDSAGGGEVDHGNAAAAVPSATGKPKKQSSFCLSQENDRYVLSEPDSAHKGDEGFATYPPQIMSRLSKTATAMIAAGYDTECCQVYSIARRNAFEDSLKRTGLEKISMDDVQKLTWESLEGVITSWTKACKRCVAVYFPGEKKLCEAVFPQWTGINPGLLSNLTRGVVIQLLNFAEAVAMTKRSVEKLFKFLDMYEALRDLILVLDELFPGDASPELKSETASARRRLGRAAVGSFSDLENSIKADTGKIPVPGGAVHPLTRYVMNYLKYACGEYKDTMEQVYQEHARSDRHDEPPEPDGGGQRAPPRSPFVVQLNEVMDLLDNNLDAKSKLYKDPSLSYIFLMNNRRYIMQKIKGSAEIHALLGDTRKRAAQLRHCHKNYTWETWSKVLACLKDDGLMQGKGSVNKTVLKERFKSFNTLFEEIHKTQSTWVVSDEQLQSELRVSISAVIVPAYRSFLGRFRQYLDSGRQAEKYIKFGPEELESSIEDLFDGTPASMVRRRS